MVGYYSPGLSVHLVGVWYSAHSAFLTLSLGPPPGSATSATAAQDKSLPASRGPSCCCSLSTSVVFQHCLDRSAN